MARAQTYLALIIAYLATLFYIAAMCTPWWYTKYHAVGQSNSDFNNNNPGLNSRGLFSRSNCFIDGSCITGDVIYKNNSNLQWVYTTTLVLLIVGWIPWLFFLHLLHSRANKNRNPLKGRRVLMAIAALLTMAFILTAIIVFAAGMTQNNGVYNSSGLYGSRLVLRNNQGFTGTDYNGDTQANNNKRQVIESAVSGISEVSASVASEISEASASASFSSSGSSSSSTGPSESSSSSTGSAASSLFGWKPSDNDNALSPVTFGSMPFGGRSSALLGAGIPLLVNTPTANGGDLPYTGSVNGTLAYKWGTHAGWYLAMIPLILIPLALLMGLLIKPKQRVVTQSRTTERSVVTQPTVVPQNQMGMAQPMQSMPAQYGQPAYNKVV